MYFRKRFRKILVFYRNNIDLSQYFVKSLVCESCLSLKSYNSNHYDRKTSNTFRHVGG